MPILQESWSRVRSVYLALNAFVTRDLWDADLVSKLDPRMLSAKRAATASSAASSNWWDDWTDDTLMSNPTFSRALPQTSSHSRSPPANSHAFAARVNRHTISDPDAPTWTQAMNGPDQTEWFKAAQLEFTTLESNLGAWELVEREPWMRVLPSKWVFKIKRLPSCMASKFKARFVSPDCRINLR